MGEELTPNILGDDLDAPKPSNPKRSQKKAALDDEGERKFRIVLEENDQIPPTGQFLSVNGEAIVIKPGEEVTVKQKFLHVLENALASMPIVGDDQRVIGYRDRMRMPFRNLGPA